MECRNIVHIHCHLRRIKLVKVGKYFYLILPAMLLVPNQESPIHPSHSAVARIFLLS